MQDQYRRVEEEYFKLRGQLAVGRITREQFETALHALMLTDAQGRSWMLGIETGKWHMYDGGQWLVADPYAMGAAAAASQPSGALDAGPLASSTPAPAPAPQPVTAPPAPAKSGGGCRRALVVGCLGLVVICLILAGATLLTGPNDISCVLFESCP
jgi:hypothetical protein